MTLWNWKHLWNQLEILIGWLPIWIQKTGVGLGDSIRQVHSQDINVSSVDLLVDSGYNLPGDHDADVRYQIKVDPPTGDAFQLDSFTRAQWDALSTLSNRTNNPRNRQSDRAVINQTISGTTYSIHKGSGDHVVFGASATGNYTVTITELSAGALDAIPHFKSTDATVDTLSDTDTIPAFVGSDNDRRRITVANAKTLFGGGSSGGGGMGDIGTQLVDTLTIASASSSAVSFTGNDALDFSDLEIGDVVIAYQRLVNSAHVHHQVFRVSSNSGRKSINGWIRTGAGSSVGSLRIFLDDLSETGNAGQTITPTTGSQVPNGAIDFYKLVGAKGDQGDPGPAGANRTITEVYNATVTVNRTWTNLNVDTSSWSNNDILKGYTQSDGVPWPIGEVSVRLLKANPRSSLSGTSTSLANVILSNRQFFGSGGSATFNLAVNTSGALYAQNVGSSDTQYTNLTLERIF